MLYGGFNGSVALDMVLPSFMRCMDFSGLGGLDTFGGCRAQLHRL